MSRRPPRPDLTLDQIRAILREQLPDLRETYGVKTLGVFGSYARGEQRARSDLDLLVEFDDRPLTLFPFRALENELSDRLDIKVDLVEKSALKPGIGRNILREVLPV